MPSTFLGLNTAYTGLQAAQVAINTTAHNISNVKTTGYSRQQAVVTADGALLTNASYGTLGTGVIVNSIDQLRNSYYDVKYRNNLSSYGRYTTSATYMTQLEDYLNEFTLEGFTTDYANFFGSVVQLQKTPAEESVREQFLSDAQTIASYFNTLSENLQNVQEDLNQEIKNSVSTINTIARNIASLNKQINQIEASKGTANDLRDARNNLVDELSQIVNVETSEQEVGNGVTIYDVKINGQTLVDNYNYNTLVTESRTEKRNASDADGLYDISWSGGLGFDIYSHTLSGNLKALVDVRDGCNECVEEVQRDAAGNVVTDAQGNPLMTETAKPVNNTDFKGVPYYQAQLNQFTQIFASGVNDILAGPDAKTIDGEPGIPLFVSQYTGTGITASSIKVNPDLIEDQSKLATTTDAAEGESKSDLMDTLLAFRDSKVFDGGTGAYFLESIVGDVSIDSSKSTQFSTNFTNLKNTIQNQRLSVMGVDEDEEGMDLMRFQEAYNLSSKMLSVMNEIYDKLINQTGL